MKKKPSPKEIQEMVEKYENEKNARWQKGNLPRKWSWAGIKVRVRRLFSF